MSHLDGREDDSGVGVGQPGSDALADGLGLPLVLRGVVRQRVQDEHLDQEIIKLVFDPVCPISAPHPHLAPLCALVEGGE